MSVTPIDLSQLPSPDVVETIDYETLLAARKARFVSLYPADEQAEIAATLALESEPVVKLLQENAYREIVLRQRVNDAARAVMLAYAVGTDLDHLAALFGIRRLTITPADPEHDVAAVMESDTDLRARTQLAPQSLSVAGPEGAYVSHARNADGRVLDASAVSPAPCEVLVSVLARDGDGTADPALIAAVAAALQADDVRPLTDKVTVRGAEILRYHARAARVLRRPGSRGGARGSQPRDEEIHRIHAPPRDGGHARRIYRSRGRRAEGDPRKPVRRPAGDEAAGAVLHRNRADRRRCTAMNDVLPPNATRLERRLAATNARIDDVPTPLATLMNPDAIRSDLLPWLAWHLGVDAWKDYWPEYVKRAWVGQAIPIARRRHRRRGARSRRGLRRKHRPA